MPCTVEGELPQTSAIVFSRNSAHQHPHSMAGMVASLRRRRGAWDGEIYVARRRHEQNIQTNCSITSCRVPYKLSRYVRWPAESHNATSNLVTPQCRRLLLQPPTTSAPLWRLSTTSSLYPILMCDIVLRYGL